MSTEEYEKILKEIGIFYLLQEWEQDLKISGMTSCLEKRTQLPSKGDGAVLATERKQEIIGKFRSHESDTGSPEVQIALLTRRIEQLTEHLQTHGHDESSRRGLLKMVSQRRRLLDYLKRTEHERYVSVIDRLGLRK